MAALTAWVLAGARSQPVALAFEDLHWADPTSLDLMARLPERGAQTPLLITTTTRPEFRPPWGLRSHHCVISLAPLDRAGVALMVGELASRHELPKDVIDGVSERTGGVPLFVEEVTRLLLERGVEGGAQAIPPTLQQSLAARLDRLGEAREIAQVGAVLGRDFSYALLSAVGGAGDPALQNALDRLAEADILVVDGVGHEAAYRFKHALIQDAAYDSLLKSRRRALHRRAAEALRQASAEPEAIAHHYTEAGLDDLAIEWWGKAGDQALRRSAFQEAIAHLGKAIAMADKAGAAPRRAENAASSSQRLKLQSDYGRAMMWSQGFGSDEAQAAFVRAQELVVGTENVDARFEAYSGLWLGGIQRGELTLAEETANTFRGEAIERARLTEVAVADRYLGLTSFLKGDFSEAQAHLEDALRIYDPERDRETRNRFGIDTGFGATLFLSRTTLMLGELERARKLIEETIARAVELAHVPDLLNAYAFKAMHEAILGDAEATLRAAETLAEIHRKHRTERWSVLFSAWARARLGDCETGKTELRRGLTAYINKKSKVYVPFFQGLLAELEAEGQDLEGALARIDEALALAHETGEQWTDPFLHRLRGEIHLKRDPGNLGPAEKAFVTALAITERQRGRFFGLCAALSLAKLYQSTARPIEAHAVLAPALEGFSPTLEMPEIAEAQVLLAALAETQEVKATTASRKRRLQLQANYGLALTYSLGVAAEETKAAATRTQRLAAEVSDSAARFAVYYGQWLASLIGGQMGSARATAETYLREARMVGDLPDIASASRMLGHVRMM